MEQFHADYGERLIILATPNIPLEGSSYDFRKTYTRELLVPFRYFGKPHPELFDFQRKPKFQPTNVHFFYEQQNELGAYGVEELKNDSPVYGNVEQFEKGYFTPDGFLFDSLGELSSGKGASSNNTTMLMIGICQNVFRNQVISLLNAYQEKNPVLSDVYENGQVHVLRLGFQKDIDALVGKMGKPNEYTSSDAIINPILAIPFENQDQIIDLKDVLFGINLWQLYDVRYAAYKWNEVHEGTAVMRVDIDYVHPENIILCISKLA